MVAMCTVHLQQQLPRILMALFLFIKATIFFLTDDAGIIIGQ